MEHFGGLTLSISFRRAIALSLQESNAAHARGLKGPPEVIEILDDDDDVVETTPSGFDTPATNADDADEQQAA